MIELALSLLGNGRSSEAVFANLREMYDGTMPDAEIRSVITWAVTKNPQPSGSGKDGHFKAAPRPLPVTPASAAAAVEKVLKGFRCEEVDLWELSPWRPLEDSALDSLLIFAALFHAGELVNVCVEHGLGITKNRDEWMAHIRREGVPSGTLGCLFRPNPVSGTPTGEKGGWTDLDVAAHRFAVVESDVLPLDLQLAVLAKLSLPIAAIIFSGGKSYHALVTIDAPDAGTYRQAVGRMLSLLRRHGFDQATGNPSRMSRLPGARRGQGQQRLVYLNPDATGSKPIWR